MKGLTRRQQQILDYISNSIQERGYPPTIREIGREMGIRSTNGVNDHLKALERKGYLRRDDLKSRAMRPVNMDTEMVDVPLLGDVAAGQPILAIEQSEDTVKVDRFFLKGNRDVFALRIKGESMIEDGILDGDFVFVKKTPEARTGDVVIALIEGEATCKRYFPEGDQIRFQPANAAMDPIYVHKEEFRETMILGSVVGIYRRY
ncbi:MAG: transcriptional repressor LexA [Bradymonadia bacterium]